MTQRFPGGSKSRVNLAGNNIRNGCASFEDLLAIDEWRAAHSKVLNTFQASLRNRTRDTNIYVAQRHKRQSTIFGKLFRFPKMQLARMDDVAGCRLIFPDIDSLYKFRNNFHKARFRHRRKNKIDKYDYIKSPKATGYRGVHDVYTYDVNSISGKDLKGLMVEIQYRTQAQHAWATAVEVIGFITENQPKFQEGDMRYLNALSLASEIIARSSEGRVGTHYNLEDTELVKQFLQLDKELSLLQMLSALNATETEQTAKKNLILIVDDDGGLEIQTYRDAPEALRALFQLENDRPDSDIVLVKADSSEEIRYAFRNYFSDATDFIRFVEEGCRTLSGNQRIIDYDAIEL